VRLIFQARFATCDEAFVAERRIKGWSRRKKLALARGDWKEIERLARI
jgi:predicted GIY-YIG superfamily endonuclease